MPFPAPRLAAALAGLALGGALVTGSPASADDTSARDRAAATPRSTADQARTWQESRRAAEAALARAQRDLRADDSDAADGRTARRAGSEAGHDHARDLTLALRDVRVGLPYLDDGDRAAARRVLARPTDTYDEDRWDPSAPRRKECGEHVCLRWVTTTADAPPPADNNGVADGDGVPDRVELALEVMEGAWDRIVTQGGYRAPLGDGSRGGDARLDVYFADTSYFGYTVGDGEGPGRTFSTYMVLDNDFADFGDDQTPEDFLRVTAVHEFFHAVQFGYDGGEDDWLMEGTATWIEDELVDEVDDNMRYLRGTENGSPLSDPAVALDRWSYSSWVFWRYLTETFPERGSSGLPVIIRDTWRRAQAYTPNYPRLYSMQAVNRAVAARDNSLANVFARFGEANRHPADAYDEGAEQHYPTVPAVASYTLSTSRRSIGEKVATMAHMTSYTIVLRPSTDLASADWTVRIPVNAPNYSRGSRAQLTVVAQDGTRTRRWVALDKYGNGAARAQFRHGQVRQVELTITNAGQRYKCNQGTYLSCRGTSLDNGLKTYFNATLQR